MEDYILREIDRIGELLLKIARKLGLLDGDTPDYSLADVKGEFDRESLPFDLETVLSQENPVWYLAATVGLSDHALESFIEILFHSDLAEDRKAALLKDALAYFYGKGYFSIRLHSLLSD